MKEKKSSKFHKCKLSREQGEGDWKATFISGMVLLALPGKLKGLCKYCLSMLLKSRFMNFYLLNIFFYSLLSFPILKAPLCPHGEAQRHASRKPSSRTRLTFLTPFSLLALSTFCITRAAETAVSPGYVVKCSPHGAFGWQVACELSLRSQICLFVVLGPAHHQVRVKGHRRTWCALPIPLSRPHCSWGRIHSSSRRPHRGGCSWQCVQSWWLLTPWIPGG